MKRGEIQGTSSLANLNNDEPGPASDEPALIVRQDDRAVFIVRLVVIGVIILAAAATSTLIYVFAHNSEVEAYESSYQILADRLIEAFFTDFLLKAGLAKGVRNSLNAILEESQKPLTNLNISQDIWSELAEIPVINGQAITVGWSPVLRGQEERMVLEESVALDFGSQSVEECYLCEDPTTAIVNRDDTVNIPGVGRHSCDTVDQATSAGLVPDGYCATVRELALEVCRCGPTEHPRQERNIKPASDKVYRLSDTEEVIVEPYEDGITIPIRQITSSSKIVASPVLYNLLSSNEHKQPLQLMLETGNVVVTDILLRGETPLYDHFIPEKKTVASILYPLFDKTRNIIGVVNVDFTWESFITSVFPSLGKFVDIVITNQCSGSYTYKVNIENDSLELVGKGDLHDPAYSHSEVSSTESEFDFLTNDTGDASCRYFFSVYSTKQLEAEFVSSEPAIFVAVACSIFLFTAAVFWTYDFLVKRRQKKVMASATRTNDIVRSLFPENVRYRLLQRNVGSVAADDKPAFGDENIPYETSSVGPSSEPIADLFPCATVMILDIVGFTCFASERTATEVFTLLESLYCAFDKISSKMDVFKVETIGDSYVAVCGLPSAREDHAVVMAEFASKCLVEMINVTNALEIHLGPATGDLRARVGLHSGPVTAGVLRGAKARFQLFGDTVNTAARLEATSAPHRIHASKETADILVEMGKSEWVKPRQENVRLKGKGEYQTYWIQPSQMQETLRGLHADILHDETNDTRDQLNIQRLVDWNTEILSKYLQRVEEMRDPDKQVSVRSDLEHDQQQGKQVIDEMKDIINFPSVTTSTKSKRQQKIDPDVKEELREFIQCIANLYRNVPFHNFEHCCHVVMSASKLMKRMMDPAKNGKEGEDGSRAAHESTYGLSSDPLLPFSCVFAALIHDADHRGVSNTELSGTDIAKIYRNKSVAEQNSVDLAWKLLMDEKFTNLRSSIYVSTTELVHFRQLVVNAVMATDIADKQLKELREERWKDAFTVSEANEDPSIIATNRKATIVFEYIIQASDIAHTMQHWLTYIKFNRRLFEERYLAYQNGHCEKDPSEGWYKGELWFFDNYIIPLANKLRECGVFGVSHFEFLAYAKENRSEWVVKGEQVVASMLSECKEKYGGALNHV